MKIHNFLHMCSVKNLNTCVMDFCVMFVVWSVSVHSTFYSF
jgi:hypothetical protein